MKAGMFSDNTMITRRNSRREIKGQQGSASVAAGADQMARLLEIAQQMGGPLNVVLGRAEYLLEQDGNEQTRRSARAIFSQVQQLVELRQQLMAEVCTALGEGDAGPAMDRGVTV